MTNTTIFLQGQKAFLSGDLEESIRAFSEALEQGVHSFYSHLNRGIAYFKIGQFLRAIEDFDVIIKNDDVHPRALFYRGLANLNLGRNEEAIHDLDKSIAYNPDRGATYLARGLAHHALGHRDKATKDIHDSHVLRDVEFGEFIEESILSEALFNRTLKYFEEDDASWNLSLTGSEVQRMGVVH
jgi:tetratricopeptide (TPR) repeat protein